MTTTDTKRITAQTAAHMLQVRDGCTFLVDGITVIPLGRLTIVQAARKLHDFKMTWKD
jgi:hypothetical protein